MPFSLGFNLWSRFAEVARMLHPLKTNTPLPEGSHRACHGEGSLFGSVFGVIADSGAFAAPLLVAPPWFVLRVAMFRLRQ